MEFSGSAMVLHPGGCSSPRRLTISSDRIYCLYITAGRCKDTNSLHVNAYELWYEMLHTGQQ